MPKVKAHELELKSKEEIMKTLDSLKQELASARVQKVSSGGQNAKVSKLRTLRKDIARVLTVIRKRQLGDLRKYYAKKKYTPLDLRVKKTRALRRKLTKFEESQETERQFKKRIHFGPRLYAVKA